MRNEICPCYSELKDVCRIGNDKCDDKFRRCVVVDILIDNLKLQKEDVIKKEKLVGKYKGIKMFKNELEISMAKVNDLESNFKDF